MTTNMITVTSTMDSLIGAYRAHVLGRMLPAAAHVSFYPGHREIAVQPDGGLDLACKLGNVLMWSYTLTGATAEWTHTDGGRLHVEVIGRTSGGALIKVYGGGQFTECRGLVCLASGEREGVSLDELYALVGLLREAHEPREVA